MASEKAQSAGIFRFAGIVCLVCSLVVSTAAVSLRGIQRQNAENEKKINILRAAGLADAGERLAAAEIETRYRKILPLVVHLKTGTLDTTKNPQSYDMYAAAENPRQSHALSADPAGIKRIAEAGSAYVLIENGKIERVILPVQGYGLWSTLYGFTALRFDGKAETINGITFYKQGETPGLGARITEPDWQAGWRGVKPYDARGKAHVVLAKKRDPNRKNQVDAIAGATLTSNGVAHLINFWLGEQGYKPFIERLHRGEITVAEMRAARKKAGMRPAGE